MNNPKFDQQIRVIQSLYNRKNNDYAQTDNPYSNFELAASVAGISVEQVFLTLIGVKIARIQELTTGKKPNFESLQDSRTDLAVYAAIYASYYSEEPSAKRK